MTALCPCPLPEYKRESQRAVSFMLDTFYFMTSPFILGGGRRNIGTRGLKKKEETLHSAFRGTQFWRDDSWSGLTEHKPQTTPWVFQILVRWKL